MSGRLSPSDRLTITTAARELYATMSLEAVRDELRRRGIRVSPNTVSELLHAAGVELRRRGGRRSRIGTRPPGGRADPLGEREREIILSVAREVYPAQTIPAVTQKVAERGLRVSTTTIRNVLASAGVEIARPGRRPIPERKPVRPSSPGVVAWDAMCERHRALLGMHRGALAGVARRLSGLRELTPRQQAKLEEVRQELRNVQDAAAACPDCRGGAGS